MGFFFMCSKFGYEYFKTKWVQKLLLVCYVIANGLSNKTVSSFQRFLRL